MNNLWDQVDHCPRYLTFANVLSGTLAIIGVLLWVIGIIISTTACADVRNVCNSTVIDGKCYLNLLQSNITYCEIDCNDNPNRNSEGVWTETKCYYNSGLMDCPDQECENHFYPAVIPLISIGGIMILLSICISIGNCMKCW